MKEVNKFYRLYIDKSKAKHEFELSELDKELFRGATNAFITGDNISGGEVIYTKTTQKDYDQAFKKKILNIEPVYRISDFLDFHFDNYNNTNNDKKLFITHIKYVILPLISKFKRSKPFEEIIEIWQKKEEMNLKEEKEKRIEYLKLVYKYAKESSPISPESAFFGLSKHQKINLQTKEIINNDGEKGGYIIGEQIGLSQTEVDSFVRHFSNNEIGYMSATLGLKTFNITTKGILYLETLEEDNNVSNNAINISGTINSPFQIQQNSNNSNQKQEIKYSEENIKEFFNLLKSELNNVDKEITEDFITEIEYAEKQISKKRDIKTQLTNIGNLMKDVGINTFANLLASPIFEMVKPFLGM